MSSDEKRKGFIDHLLSLASEGEEDRGALAELRSGLGKEMGEMTRVHKHVVPYLPEQNDNDRWYYLAATLFGMHPKHRDPVQHESNGRKWTDVWTVGRAFRTLREAKEKRDSLDARFIALLNAHSDDLSDHLRHAVSLLKANDEQPLDWSRLLEDLFRWNDPERPVQLRWALDYYKEINQGKSGSASNTSGNQTAKEEEEDHE